MKLCAPKYYKDFVCIADKCMHSCCIGWEIDIDPDTAKKYSSLSGSYAEIIKHSISWDDVPHFKLDKKEHCPHLDQNGLCKIILEFGEDHLCEICREHPRFYNDTARGKEVGLGLCCEEAARLILSSDAYSEMVELCETEGISEVDFDTLRLRDDLYSILSDVSLPYAERLQKIYDRYGVSPSSKNDMEWQEILASLEYLDGAHKDMFAHYSFDAAVPDDAEKALERALAYFIYRHCTEVCDDDELRTHLGFCLFCERLLASLVKAYATDDIIRLARIVSEEIEYSEDNTEIIKNCF